LEAAKGDLIQQRIEVGIRTDEEHLFTTRGQLEAGVETYL
jgi:hypothetical protein